MGRHLPTMCKNVGLIPRTTPRHTHRKKRGRLGCRFRILESIPWPHPDRMVKVNAATHHFQLLSPQADGTVILPVPTLFSLWHRRKLSHPLGPHSGGGEAGDRARRQVAQGHVLARLALNPHADSGPVLSLNCTAQRHTVGQGNTTLPGGLRLTASRV